MLRPGDGARSCAVSPGVSEGRGRYGWGGGRRRGRELGAFTATQSLICCSRVQPPLLCLDAPPAPSLAPPRAARRSIRPLCCGIVDLCPLICLALPLLLVRRMRGRWRGKRGHNIIAFSSSILGDARHQLCAAATHSRPIRPAVRRSSSFVALRAWSCGCWLCTVDRENMQRGRSLPARDLCLRGTTTTRRRTRRRRTRCLSASPELDPGSER